MMEVIKAAVHFFTNPLVILAIALGFGDKFARR